MTHRISLQPAQRTFDVADGETILAAAIRQGVGLPYGCRDGACGSCKSRLLDGQVEHGPHQLKALSAAEARSGLILTCCARPLSDCAVEARSVPADGQHPVLKLPVRVISLEREAPDVMVMRLQLPANQNFRFHAGQYVEFILRDGSRRSYSMANPPEALGDPPSIELHLRHMPGGKFTDHVFGTMKPRDILRLEGPLGSFFLRPGEAPIVLLASGTGFAPIQALIGALEAQPQPRQVTLYWGCRRQADLYRHAWCEAKAAELPWLRYVPVLSEPDRLDAWTGRTGLVHQAVMADWPDLSGHEVYACGAPVMVDAARSDFTTLCGLPEQAFYADAFTSEADKHGPAA